MFLRKCLFFVISLAINTHEHSHKTSYIHQSSFLCIKPFHIPTTREKVVPKTLILITTIIKMSKKRTLEFAKNMTAKRSKDHLNSCTRTNRIFQVLLKYYNLRLIKIYR